MVSAFGSQFPITRTFLLKNKRSGLYLTVAGYSTEVSAKLEQGPLQPDDDINRDGQVWFVFPINGGRFLVTNLKSSLFLDVVGNSRIEGALIEQTSIVRSDDPEATQFWAMKYHGRYLALKNVVTGYYLSVVDFSTVPGAAIQQLPKLETSPNRDSQLWKFEIEHKFPDVPAAVLSVKKEGSHPDGIPTFTPDCIAAEKTAEMLVGQAVIPGPLINEESGSMYYVLRRYVHWELVHHYRHFSFNNQSIVLDTRFGLTSDNAEQVKRITGITMNSDASLVLSEPMTLFSKILALKLKTKLKSLADVSDRKNDHKHVPLSFKINGVPKTQLIWYRNDRFLLLRMDGVQALEWTSKNLASRRFECELPDENLECKEDEIIDCRLLGAGTVIADMKFND